MRQTRTPDLHEQLGAARRAIKRYRIAYSVHPRYTPGSPGLVDRAQALRVAQQEKEAHSWDLSGSFGNVAELRAKEQGLEGIITVPVEIRGNVYRVEALEQLINGTL